MNGATRILVLSTLALAGCNTSDALVPPEDLTAAHNSAPVTQAETARIAAEPSSSYSSGYGGSSQPLPPPQNTLEAQARALQGGASLSPAASQPMPPPLEQSQQQATLSPAAQSAGTIRFLPIIGAPVQAVTPLSRQLGASARAGGLTIKGSNDTDADHVLKGYLSAYADGGKTVVVYVWDILDAGGARLHRIQGQEDAPASRGDPWAGVPPSTMQTIGEKTVSGYREWLATRRG